MARAFLKFANVALIAAGIAVAGAHAAAVVEAWRYESSLPPFDPTGLEERAAALDSRIEAARAWQRSMGVLKARGAGAVLASGGIL